MESSRFTASLLRASAEGYAGMATSRLVGDGSGASADGEAFNSWKGHFERLVFELAAAVEDEAPERFAAHLAWARRAFAARGISDEVLVAGLDALHAVLDEALPPASRSALPAPFEHARQTLARSPEPTASPLAGDGPAGALARAYLEAVLEGQPTRANGLVLDAVRAGSLDVHAAITDVLLPVLTEVGERWHGHGLSVAEEHLTRVAAQRLLALLVEVAPPVEPRGRTVLVSAVPGDTHDLGVQVVAAFFELAGWRTLCLGADTPAADLAQLATRLDADVVALGASLDVHREAAAETVRALRAARPDQRVLVGGSAFEGRESLWRRAGADACASSPAGAVRAAEALLGG